MLHKFRGPHYMESFFEKLKKGMGIEEEIEELSEEGEEEIIKKPIRKKGVRKVKKPKKLEIKEEQIKKGEEKTEEKQIEEVKEKEIPQIKISETKEKLFEQEGELAIDVYQTANDLVIQSAIAGVKPENLDITLEKDIITIKGVREKPFEEEGDYFSQECFWGPFSREVILPAEVDPNRATAEMRDGILTIRIPKILREKKRKIIVRG